MDFIGANNQFCFFTMSLVYDKSDQHRSIYDSFKVELASTKTMSITLENASNTYSAFNSIKLHTDNHSILTNTYSIISFRLDTAKSLALFRHAIMQIIHCFKNYLPELSILQLPTRKYLSI